MTENLPLPFIVGLTACVLGGSLCAQNGGRRQSLDARAFGLAADGATDDGPAIERLLAEVTKMARRSANTPLLVRFPPNATIRVEHCRERYVFPLDHLSGVTIDGGGSTFLLGSAVRFLRMTHCSDMTVRNLAVDFDPLPFVDGTVIAVDPVERCIDVQVQGDARRIAGGPTHQDGEQAFFGMLWRSGRYGTISMHYWIDRCVALPAPGQVRVYATDRFTTFDKIRSGADRISLPVPGVAHRYGPGACFQIGDCTRRISIEDVELWSAPWMGFFVYRNDGDVRFHHVHIRPKPGTGRLMSTWRDGFHVKGNRARLLWEDCIITGMNDDAFNISTHCSRVQDIPGQGMLRVLQIFPLTPMPWHAGATLLAADGDAGVLLGSAKILEVIGWTVSRRLEGKPAASPVILCLDRSIPGIGPGTIVWERESANPDTVLRRCKIGMSCRLQSPVVLESCRATALLWFHREEIEGPYPSHVTVRDCRIRQGRGNPRLAVAFSGRRPGADGASALHDVIFENNQVWGDFRMTGVDRARLVGNRFHDSAEWTVRIDACRYVTLENNSFPDEASPGKLEDAAPQMKGKTP